MTGVIMIIEDNPSHRKLYSAVLNAHGYQPQMLNDGRSAATTAVETQAIAIIVDILLPHIDGREIIAQLRDDERTSAIPILAISAAADENMSGECLAAGADCFHAKPVPLSVLVSEIALLTSRA